MSYKIGAVSSARIDDDAITSAKLADDSVIAAAIATHAVVADGIAADAVGASEIAANAVGASELADNAVDTAAVADAAITSAKLASTISIADLTVTGDLSVIGNSSSITLEEVQVDQAKIILNREDSTDFTSLSGNVGLVVKGGSDEDVMMVFDTNGSNPRANFKDESGDFIEIKGGAGTFTGDLSCGGITGTGTLTLSNGPNNFSFNANTGAVSASGAVSATGGFTGALTGNASTATALASAQVFELSGDVTGSASFDGTGTCSITTTIGANSLELGTATTGNYVATVAAGSGVNGLAVSGSGSETAAVELSLHGSLESAVDAFAAADYSGGKKYLGMWTSATASETIQIGGTGLDVVACQTDSALRTAAGLGDGYTVAHGDLKSANGRLIESIQLWRPGHGSYSSSASSNNAYNATVILEGDNATSAVNYHLPLIDNSDASGQKMKYGQKMQIKLSKIGSGGSVVLALPSGQAGFDSDTKIDGAASFTLTEVNQAITIVAAQDNDGNPQYFIV